MSLSPHKLLHAANIEAVSSLSPSKFSKFVNVNDINHKNPFITVKTNESFAVSTSRSKTSEPMSF